MFSWMHLLLIVSMGRNVGHHRNLQINQFTDKFYGFHCAAVSSDIFLETWWSFPPIFFRSRLKQIRKYPMTQRRCKTHSASLVPIEFDLSRQQRMRQLPHVYALRCNVSDWLLAFCNTIWFVQTAIFEIRRSEVTGTYLNLAIRFVLLLTTVFLETLWSFPPIFFRARLKQIRKYPMTQRRCKTHSASLVPIEFDLSRQQRMRQLPHVYALRCNVSDRLLAFCNTIWFVQTAIFEIRRSEVTSTYLSLAIRFVLLLTTVFHYTLVQTPAKLVRKLVNPLTAKLVRKPETYQTWPLICKLL